MDLAMCLLKEKIIAATNENTQCVKNNQRSEESKEFQPDNYQMIN